MKLNQLISRTDHIQNITIKDIHKISAFPDDTPDEVIGFVMCNNNHLTTLKGSPKIVGGAFHCYDNRLTSLADGPTIVRGSYYCAGNQLTTLEGAPKVVGDTFLCSMNHLTSLEGAPEEIHGGFYCNNNNLTSLEYIHKRIKKVSYNFQCYGNPIRSHILGLMMIEIGGEIETKLGNGSDVDAILNKWKNQGRKGVMGAMKELLDLGYEELAQL